MVSAGTLHATLGFMQQIERALQQQSEKLNLLQKQTEQARQRYLDQHGKVRALTGLMDKLDLEHAASEEKTTTETGR